MAPIRLADEADFRLGEIAVHPALCSLQVGDHEETVEPRVMQVLVALTAARDTVVSRDDLVQSCWGGRIVGDDAITGCLVKVRKLAALTEAPAFKIETIPRVGYRLRLGETNRPDTRQSDDPRLRTPEAEMEPKLSTTLLPKVGWTRRSKLILGLAITVLCGGMLGGAWLTFQKSARWSVVRSEVLIAANSIQRWPAVSPDGKFIAYAGGSDVFSRKILLEPSNGGEPLHLTDDAGDDSSPAWSPDGSQLAYVNIQKDGHCRLMITRVPVGSPREVGSCEHNNRSSVTWGRSDQELLFADQPQTARGGRVMSVDLTNGRRSQVTHPLNNDADDAGPVVSPDRRFIVFSRCLGYIDCNLVILDVRAGTEQLLNIDQVGYAWGPDSKSLFIDTEENGDFALWSVPIGDAPRQRIVSSPKIMHRISIGPQGLLAVEIDELSSSLARMTAGEGEVPPVLAPERGIDCASDIAPNGTIAVMSQRLGGAGLWLLPKDGQIHKLIELTRDEILWAQPRWSPDGKMIAFDSPPTKPLGIRIITALGTELAFVPANGDDITAPAWTEDGNALIFPVHDDQGWRLWRAELTHPAAPKPLAYEGWINIRSAGATLYGVRDNEAGVWRIDDQPEKITPLPAADLARQWTISDNEIIYPEGATVSKKVFAQPIQGGPNHIAGYALPRVPDFGFSVDPISKAIVYPEIQYFNSDIELLHLIKQ